MFHIINDTSKISDHHDRGFEIIIRIFGTSQIFVHFKNYQKYGYKENVK